MKKNILRTVLERHLWKTPKYISQDPTYPLLICNRQFEPPVCCSLDRTTSTLSNPAGRVEVGGRAEQ